MQKSTFALRDHSFLCLESAAAVVKRVVKSTVVLQTKLHAAVNRNSGVNEVLKAHPELVDVADSDGHTPLFCAVFRNRHESIRALLEAGAKMHRTSENRSEVTPYQYAQKFGDKETVKIMEEFNHKKLVKVF